MPKRVSTERAKPRMGAASVRRRAWAAPSGAAQTPGFRRLKTCGHSSLSDGNRKQSQRRGLSTTVAKGGSVSDSDHSRPWLGRGSAAIAPALPRLPPPYQAESPLKISS